MPAIVARLIVAAVVFALALDGGTFGLVSRSSLAIAVWWTIGLTVALGLLPLSRIRPPALITGGLLTAFVAWTGASIAWSVSAERAFNEFNRAALYLGIFVAAVLLARSDTARRWSDGAAIGITAVALLALGSRLFPDAFPSDAADPYFPGPQLRYPLHYSNGLGIFVGLAMPLLLRSAVFAERALWRALAVAALPPLAAVLYLTSSRGGVAAAVLGVVGFLVLTTRRWETTAVIALGGLASSAVVAFVATQSALVDRPETAGAISQGRTTAVGIALTCAATVALYFAGHRLLRGRPTPAPSIGWTTVATVVVLAVVGIAVANPVQRFEAFKQPPDPSAESYSVRGHLFSVTSSGRWQFWRAAVNQFRAAPVAGDGAGSYEAWWAQHGSVAMFIVDAHSLYLETAGELGFVGLGLLLAAVATGLVAAVIALRHARGATRATVAALAACFAAYGLGAGIDWMWELTIVSAVGFACLGFAAQSPAWAHGERSEPAGLPLAGRVLVPLVAAVLVVLQASSLLSSISIRESEAAVQAGDAVAALDAAADARAFQPWASSPYLQLGFVQEERSQLGAALAAITEATQRDRDDWRLWLVRARIETKLERIGPARRSLARAAALNPRSPLFANAS